MSEKRSKKRIVVLCLLLLVLAVTAINTVHVFRMADENPPAVPEKYSALSGADDASSSLPPLPPGQKWGTGPGWRSGVSALKDKNGGYTVSIVAVDSVGNNIPLNSFEADIRHPGATTPAITPLFQKDDKNNITAHVDFPSPGDWEVHVRMHRDLSTLEFSQRIEIK